MSKVDGSYTLLESQWPFQQRGMIRTRLGRGTKCSDKFSRYVTEDAFEKRWRLGKEISTPVSKDLVGC